jgi:molybdate transport system ATP-binding protein
MSMPTVDGSATMTMMSDHDHLLKLAAVIYRSGEDDVDSLLATFAADLIREGHRIGGVIQHNAKGAYGPRDLMSMIDLMTGRAIPICQTLGPEAQSCKLNPAGLAEAAVSVSRAIAENVELVIVNKFSRQEAAGGGLRAEIADTVMAGLPILTAVPDKCYDAWNKFTGGFGTTLVCERRVIDDWWRETSRRDGRNRGLAKLDERLGRRAIHEAPGILPLPALLADHHVGRLDHG